MTSTKIAHLESDDTQNSLIIDARFDDELLDISLDSQNGHNTVRLNKKQVWRLIETMRKWAYKP